MREASLLHMIWVLEMFLALKSIPVMNVVVSTESVFRI